MTGHHSSAVLTLLSGTRFSTFATFTISARRNEKAVFGPVYRGSFGSFASISQTSSHLSSCNERCLPTPYPKRQPKIVSFADRDLSTVKDYIFGGGGSGKG